MKLEDYLPFYLGCQFMFDNKNWLLVRVGARYIQGKRGSDKIECHHKDIKPILRKLSSMTEEEMKEYRLLELPVVKSLHKYVIESAFYTKWLLSKHFDLFNLIDAGLALDRAEVDAKNIKLNKLPNQ